MMWDVGIRRACVYFVLVLCFEQSRCFDYCSLPKCPQGPHTMCEYSNGPGSACKEYDKGLSSISQSEKENILDAHNKYRSTVANGKETRSPDGSGQPAASDMMELIWDAELEEIALRWAGQCIYTHDKCRKTKNDVYAGQNAGMSSDKKGSNILHVDNWYNEAKDFDKSLLTSFSTPSGGPSIGHYTQGVWAKTRRIGCGKAVFFYDKFNKVSSMLICNYGPGGNTLTMQVYTEGSACSACPDGLPCSSKYSGLCKNPDKSTFFNTAVNKFDSGLMVFFTLLPIINGFLSGGSLS